MTLEELQRECDETRENISKFDSLQDEGGNLPENVAIQRLQLMLRLSNLKTLIKRMSEARRVKVSTGEPKFYQCPTCKVIVSIRDKRPDIEYCWHCDQKLDWGTEVGRDSERSD